MNLVTLPLATPSQLPPYVASKIRMAFAGFLSAAAALPTGEQRIMEATNPSAQPLCIYWFRDLYRRPNNGRGTSRRLPKAANQQTRERPPTREHRGPSTQARCKVGPAPA